MTNEIIDADEANRAINIVRRLEQNMNLDCATQCKFFKKYDKPRLIDGRICIGRCHNSGICGEHL